MKTEKCRYEVFIGCSRDNQDLRDLADAFASATVECGHFPCPFVLPDVAESEPGLRERIRDADLVVLLSKTNDATLNTQVKALLRDNQPTLKFLIDSPQESASEPPEPSVPGAPVLYRFSSKRGVGELKYQYV